MPKKEENATGKTPAKKAAPKKTVAKKAAAQKPPLRRLNTYDEFIDIEVDWRQVLEYAYEHRNDEPYNEELFGKAMLDTQLWFASRMNKMNFSFHDVELYTHIIEYVCYFARISEDGQQDNGLLFSASQKIAAFYSHCLVINSPNVVLSQTNGGYQLIVHDSWIDNKRDFVYDFATGDIQDFVEYTKLEGENYAG